MVRHRTALPFIPRNAWKRRQEVEWTDRVEPGQLDHAARRRTRETGEHEPTRSSKARASRLTATSAIDPELDARSAGLLSLEVSSSVVSAARGISVPPWLAVVFLSVWLVALVAAFGNEIRRSRAGAATTWRQSLAEATHSFARNNALLVGRLAIFSAVGYLALVALVAQRWPAASVGLVALPLVVAGIVGFRRLGRQISARTRDGSAP